LKSKPASAPARSAIFAKPPVANGDPRSLTNTNDDAGLALQSAERPQFVAAEQVSRFRALLRPAHMQRGGLEVDL
jgi:hypothetical protein